jgi:hypothetical protein
MPLLRGAEMNYCPFHPKSHRTYSDIDFIRHLAKHSPAYARAMAVAIMKGYQEQARLMGETLREMER